MIYSYKCTSLFSLFIHIEIARVKRCGNEIDPMDKGLKQRDKIYVSMKDQKQVNH